MIDWILHYSLFLFDFDGLLADTENFHFRAYIEMCARRGFCLDWNFKKFTEVAHNKPTDLRDQIYLTLPSLQAQESNWPVLYDEKKKIFLELVESEPTKLMPGAADLLIKLENEGICRCVVTHSPLELISQIRRQNPILNTIPNWITREDYTEAKPHPECYKIALAKFGKENGKAIGFEDSARGLRALIATEAKPVFICPSDSFYLEKILLEHPQVRHYPTLSSIDNSNYP